MRYLVITPCSPRVRGGRPLVAITPYTYMHVHMHMQVGVLKLLCLMVDGPAEAETRVQVAPRPSPLAPRPVDHRVPPPPQVREELLELRVLEAAAGSSHAAEKAHLRYTSHLQHVLLRPETPMGSELTQQLSAPRWNHEHREGGEGGEGAGADEALGGGGVARRLWTARDASQMQTAWQLQHELRLALGSVATDAAGGGAAAGAGGVGGAEAGGGASLSGAAT